MPPRKRAGGSSVEIRVDQFGWEAARIATLEHSTLPWFGASGASLHIDGVSLDAATRMGSRDKLSLVAQFAAHIAFLRFAGIATSAFVPGEWMVSRRRGSDPRLIRIGAASVRDAGEMSIVTSIDSFAAFLGVRDSIQVLQQSWTKPEAVYAEILRRITTDIRAQIDWMRRAAVGTITSPGPELLRGLLTGPVTLVYSDADFLDTADRLSAGTGVPLLRLRGGSPLERFSAVAPLESLGGDPSDETAFTDRVVDRLPRAVAILQDVEKFDESSRRVVAALLPITREWTWAVPASVTDWLSVNATPEEAPDSIVFAVSPTVHAAESLSAAFGEMPTQERREWLERFVSGEALISFVERGVLPDFICSTDSVAEPRRSYLGALAIIGRTIPAELARAVLTDIGCSLDLGQLAVEPFTTLDEDAFSFRSDSVRQRFIGTLSGGSRVSFAALAARVAAKANDTLRAADLFARAGDMATACDLLESVDWTQFDAPEVIGMVGSFESAVLDSPRMAVLYASALIATGRYIDARRFCPVAGEDGRIILARAARRFGEYSRAFEALQGLHSFDARLLRGELFRLTGDLDAAEREVAAAAQSARTSVERARVAYERAILTLDRGATSGPTEALEAVPYLNARWRSYVAMSAGDYATATAEAASAERVAVTIPDRIDAAMDSLYASFIAGDWEDARHHARRALSLVEETQGDRAAGGILFTLAYLSADCGYWSEAEDAIARLDTFYARVGDERRHGELRMLRAHLAFCRGEFGEARRQLSGGTDPLWSADIREAALLIVDEIDWIESKLTLVRTTGESRCLELQRRHRLNVCRSAASSPWRPEGFAGALLLFETGTATPPQTNDRSERLRLYRSLLGILRRRTDEAVEGIAREIAAEFHISYRSPAAAEGLFGCELQLLQLLSIGHFPTLDLGEFQWRLVTRNRLGQWRQFGSLPPMSDGDLARIDAEPDRIHCGDSAFAFVQGLDQFAPKSRDAIRALFTLHYENFRMARIAEQERLSVADRPSRSADGIHGDSPGIRAALNMLDKIARRDVPVCILGESGTGKELFARSAHLKSQRRGSPFTAVNCAALPENLIESELFGHARGAFTGADRDRAGLVETTDGGTLFLDEIGEMPLVAQAKLLRFLQDGEFRRVGETQVRRADVRIIAATNRKLDAAVDEGKFREDLYYRIRGVDLMIPPLRERGSDILLLARHFLAIEREKHRAGPSGFSEDVEAVFLSYAWPGNVRELHNTIRSAHALAGDSPTIETEHLPERLQEVLVVRVPRGSYHEELTRFRRSLIEKSLLQAEGNQNQAARTLGMTRQALAYQIRELGILIKP